MELWLRENVDELRRTAYVFDSGRAVMLSAYASPADGLQAARELIGERAAFSHLKNGFPVYVTE